MEEEGAWEEEEEADACWTEGRWRVRGGSTILLRGEVGRREGGGRICCCCW